MRGSAARPSSAAARHLLPRGGEEGWCASATLFPLSRRHPDESQDPDRKGRPGLGGLSSCQAVMGDRREIAATQLYELGPDRSLRPRKRV